MSASNIKTVIAAIVALCLPMALFGSGCAAEGEPGGTEKPKDSSGAGASDPGPTGDGICLMNNCASDEQCFGCADDRNTCLVNEGRCVACDPVTGGGCEEGFTCSSFGICAPDGQTCPTDERGTPQVSCTQNTDCLACSPMHQVCDTATGQCQACTATNTQHCLASDICVEGQCSPKCPQSCNANDDCSQCGGPGAEAHACNAHKCAECSDTFPCAAGLNCVAGVCTPGCGIPGGNSSGDCLSDEDCNFCGDPNDPNNGSYECSKPINANDPTDHGTCAPVASGCSDLGNQVAVLPEPWNDYTNLCSNDNDCSGVGIQLDVGELIKDAIGSDSIDLGFTDVDIQSAIVSYDMNRCADIDITNNISCGVCVPCKVDNDCAPINIDSLIMDLFAGEPVAQIAGAFLINFLFGDQQDHNLNFFCQPVAAGYGVCAPCSNPFQACGTNQGNNTNNQSTTCDHPPTTTGNPLSPSCDSCAATVCAVDPFCCNNAWDTTCVNEAATMCASGSCAHSEYTSGAALSSSCSSCAATVCAADSYCCSGSWDSICVQAANTMCGGSSAATTTTGGGGSSSCQHDVCTQGSALDASCSSCVATVCSQDQYCCDNASGDWDSICVDLAEVHCGVSC